MQYSGFLDLDELVLQCHNEQARQHVEEAVRCYRAGAFRFCIAATWLALVYDFIHKINALHLEGDGAVREVYETIQTAQAENGIEASLQLEKTLIAQALGLELITPLEEKFLRRLQEDRHLCVHPSMQALDEPFQATAEMARAHLRNAMTFFLQHPPVQGKAALLRILADIDSEGFPRTLDDAISYFRTGRMPHARVSLVRNLAIVLTKSLLQEPEKGDRKARQFAALGAVLSLFNENGSGGIRDGLAKAAASVSDSDLSRLFAYVRYVPDSWDLLEDWLRVRMKTFIETGEPEVVAKSLLHAYNIPALEEYAKNRLHDLPPEVFLDVPELETLPESIDAAVDRFVSSGSFVEARKYGRNIVHLKGYLVIGQILRIVKAYRENGQISGCIQGPDYLRSLLSSVNENNEELIVECRDLYNITREEKIDSVLLHRFPDFREERKYNPFQDDDEENGPEPIPA